MRRSVKAAPIFGPIDTLAIEQGCRYEESAALRVRRFIERFCCHSKGRWAGQPFALLPWQWDYLRRLYGWKRADGTRRYRTAYLEVPKKNGKSMLVSALALYHLLADGESGPEVYCNACDRAQASIVYTECQRMVDASPELAKRLDAIPSTKRIVYRGGNGFLVANSADVPSKDGINSSLTIFDELHRQKTPDMWRIFLHAGVAREQPLNVSITTAGEDLESVCYEQHEYTERVNSGAVPDTEHLGVIYAAEPKDDLDEPAIWAKANPSLGETLKVDGFKAELTKAKEIPSEWATFKRLRFNLWLKTEDRFISDEAWNACGSGPIDPEGLRGSACWAGADLSSTTDLTALVGLFREDDGGFQILCRFWLPDSRVGQLSRRDRVPYRSWIERGFLESTPGDVVDYDNIRACINEFARQYDLRKLLLDPYNATQLGVKLLEEDGIPLAFLRQGYLSLSAPTKELERLILGRKIRHGWHPVLRWMAGNAIATRDAAGNVKLDKSKSRQKIDGMSALVNAIAAMSGDPESSGSVYESRGLLVL